MTITSPSKQTSSLSGQSKAVGYEIFDTLTTTFATETRTFDQMGTTWTGSSKISSSMTNPSKPS